MKKVKIGWRFDATNRAAAKRTADILAAEFEKAGIGKLTYDPANIRVSVHHHMGTTRMHRDPQYGVVDENCKVHGVDNLYIAGCSVFPTGGFVNPTLTILALAIRLADHFKQMQLPRSGELAVAQISETRLPVPLDGNLDR